MDCQQLTRFCRSLQAWLKMFDKKLAPTTISQYVAACDRMNRSNANPLEMAERSKRSFYFYRAALIHCTAKKIQTLHRLAQFAIDHGECDAAYAQVLKIKELLKILVRYQPDPERRNKRKGVPGEWVKWARENGVRSGNKSKRNVLPELHDEWRQLMWDQVPGEGKYRTAIAILSCVGARPSEFRRGIIVKRIPEGLEFSVAGTKTHEGLYGQPDRSVIISIDSAEAKYLAEQLVFCGTPLFVRATPALLKDAVVHVSKKIGGTKKGHITPYVYRHQLSGDVKDAGLPEEDVSQILGHASPDTQRYYGQRRQGRRGGNRVLAVKATRAIRPRRRVYLGPTDNGPKRGAP